MNQFLNVERNIRDQPWNHDQKYFLWFHLSKYGPLHCHHLGACQKCIISDPSRSPKLEFSERFICTIKVKMHCSLSCICSALASTPPGKRNPFSKILLYISDSCNCQQVSLNIQPKRTTSSFWFQLCPFFNLLTLGSMYYCSLHDREEYISFAIGSLAMFLFAL